jgi:hypothetical protein
MSRKSLMLALAAAVSLGTFALSSSNASAFHYTGGARAVGTGGVHLGGSGVVRLGGIGGLHVNHAMKPWPTFNPHHHVHWPRWWWWRYTWRRPYWIAPVIATGAVATGAAASYATTPTTNRCTCLTKDYTPQGAVVFKDVCTNEMAMNPPAGAPAADMAPQMPQQPMQQGYLQPQPSQVQ